MKTIFSLLLLTPVILSGASTCVTCHKDLDGDLAAPVSLWETSIHQRADVGCVDCHGGDATSDDMDLAMSPSRGFVGVPSPKMIPTLCARCHSDERYMKKYAPSIPVDQLERYKTSVHGMGWARGDANVATCASCHGAHDIVKATDPASHVYVTNVVNTCAKCHADEKLMKTYNISAEIVSDYRKGVHARAIEEKGDLAAPTCNDCHGNHGAAPPGIASIGFVCGNCHAMNQRLFNQSPHREPWQDMELSQCEECHGNHNIPPATDAMLDSKGHAVCLNCHDQGDGGYETMDKIHAILVGMTKRMEEVETRVLEAEHKGMLMDDAALLLQDAKTSYIKGRTAVHAFSAEKVKDTVGEGLGNINKASIMADEAFKELTFRRKGLFVFLIIALTLAFLLWLKIRQMDRRMPSNPE
ncbi:MAG TPA: cytochrome c3 family protein [Thermoanaerobaculia bacterium]|nr:cytochrome c3 family protein [Thermoanaerobaculia bacterium]HUM28570.1 cytochrome c3 family protein [Thermoanaerobaculia bacterium]HXK66822.1 cytochrome c3 family protein [Thermoanaerobaculia bacterium]